MEGRGVHRGAVPTVFGAGLALYLLHQSVC
jgi:hypothetical protein